MDQTELIRLHRSFTADAVGADDYQRAHYEYLLAALGRLIESHGPTQDYDEWANSTSPSESFRPIVLGR